MRLFPLLLLLAACGRPAEKPAAAVEHVDSTMTKHAVWSDCNDRVGATGLPDLDRAGNPSNAYFGALRVCFKDRFGMSDSAATALAADWMIWELAFQAVKLGGSPKPADSIQHALKTETIVVRRR